MLQAFKEASEKRLSSAFSIDLRMVSHKTPTDWATWIKAGWLLVQTLLGQTTANDLLGLRRSPSRDQNVRQDVAINNRTCILSVVRAMLASSYGLT